MGLSGFKHFAYTSLHHMGQKGTSSEFSPNPLGQDEFLEKIPQEVEITHL